MQGGTGPCSPLGAEGAFCDCLGPSNCGRFYRENVVGGRSQAPLNDDRSLFGPEGALRPESPSNDDRTAPSLGEVAPLPPPLRDFPNTLLSSIVRLLVGLLHGVNSYSIRLSRHYSGWWVRFLYLISSTNWKWFSHGK